MRVLKYLALCAVLCVGMFDRAQAEEDAKHPSTASVRTAGAALVHLVELEDAEARNAALRRYVHAPSLLARIDRAPGAWKTDAWHASAASLLVGLVAEAVRDSSRRRIERSALEPAGSVLVMRLSPTSALAWSGGPRGPLVIDVECEGAWISKTLGDAREAATGLAPLDRLRKDVGRRAQIRASMDNIRTLLVFMIARRTGKVTGGWPRYNGKNFVLSVVATNDLDRRRAENLELLFSPGGPTARPDPKRFREITKLSLKEGNFQDCTSYAGRRNMNRDWLITPDQEKRGTPLIADLHFDDVAIVGFSSGAVQVMTREQLGLGPDDPIVVGDKSKSEILQALSDE